MKVRARTRTKPLPQAKLQEFKAVIHVAAASVTSTDPDADRVIFEMTGKINAKDDWDATDDLNDWAETLLGEHGEIEAGLDPSIWMILDVTGAALYDLAGCLIVSVDAYGNNVRSRASAPRTLANAFKREDEDWEKWQRGGWADEYAEERDYTWGGNVAWGGMWGLRNDPAHCEAIKAEIATYCVERGYEGLLLDVIVLENAQ